jgi:hypothetical protein
MPRPLTGGRTNMKNEAQNIPQDARIQGLLAQYLRLRASGLTSTDVRHLDEDSLNAFVEGNLSEREAAPMLSHLIDCTFCRHVTADLVRLDLAFAETENAPAVVENTGPSRVSDVLSGILSKIFGTGDAAVFAHQESEKDSEGTGEDKEEDKKD